MLALALATHANLFLAAFAAGITVATTGQRQRETFVEFGELVAELLKLAALLVFGALITPAFLADVPARRLGVRGARDLRGPPGRAVAVASGARS